MRLKMPTMSCHEGTENRAIGLDHGKQAGEAISAAIITIVLRYLEVWDSKKV